MIREVRDVTSVTEEKYIDRMEKEFGPFWIGPYNIRVPWRIRSIISDDRVNELEWWYDRRDKKWFIMSTKVGSAMPRMTREEYLKTYGVCGKDGLWYWRETYDRPLYETKSLIGWFKCLLFGYS
jgi:hypothetical protein